MLTISLILKRSSNSVMLKKEPATWAKYLRLLVNKSLLPTTVNVYQNGDQTPLFSIHRPMAFFRSKIRVPGPGAQPFGYFKSKMFSIGGGFNVFDNSDQQVAEIKGNWKGWDFKFLTKDGREIGSVTKKWAGLGKELFFFGGQLYDFAHGCSEWKYRCEHVASGRGFGN